ncbi:hypothetical protein GY31_13530 [Lysinibacillus sphaericus]|uniref:DUF3955 domain-containing protein n=1 Tax=Lysinibacillus TaxID=400634 RepID=UPI00084B1806|nr:DUF3955 domain-containing protein [Lysinibacillus sphaericus]OEC01310.1 hypothetical protein GY31_13530 [Lysinibacillus sphaericus]
MLKSPKSIILFIASKFAPVTVQENGMKDEPYFFVTPIGALLFFIMLVYFLITQKQSLFNYIVYSQSHESLI